MFCKEKRVVGGLGVGRPERWANIEVGEFGEICAVHADTSRTHHQTLARIRDVGAQAAVALNPSTPPESVRYVLELCDMVLVMTVNPGFGGQAYISEMEPKVATLRRWITDAGLNCDIEVDGGIGPATISGAAASGANVLVAGSALYKDPEGLAHAVTELRDQATTAVGQAG